MKGPGIRVAVTGPKGVPVFRVVQPSHTEDKIWDAVSEAMDAGWEPARLMSEIREAWRDLSQQRLRWQLEEFDR